MITIYFKLVICLTVKIVVCHGVRVKVEQGWLEGEVLELVTGDGKYCSFKGIPYARPPIGTLRFKAPQPAASWSGVRDATQHGSKCPQFDILTNQYIPGDEDCLYVNVYTPNLNPRKSKSVVVFVHGGAYKSGSGDIDTYGPDYLIRKDMVVVTFNYRLDALGFLCLGTKEVPGNAGLKDQVAVLKWVKKNIRRFGGDPRKVTLIGQSAGSASVGLHIASPMSEGLFHRAIALSGSPLCDWGIPFHPVRRAFVLGKILGLETEDPNELLQFLQSLPAEQLVDTSPNILSFEEYTYNLLKMFQFVPVIEKKYGKDNFITYNIFEEYEHVNKVDLMFGNTDQEVVSIIVPITSMLLEDYNKYPELFVPRKLLNRLGPNSILKLSDKIVEFYFGNKTIDINSIKEFVNYANQATFVYDSLRYYLRLPMNEDTVRYQYEFSILSSLNIYGLQGKEYGIVGAGHLDDLRYLFHPSAYNQTINRDSTEFKLIDQVCTIYTDFAKHGNPFHSSRRGATWPLSNPWTKLFVNLKNNLSNIITTVSSLNYDKNFQFWEQLYSSV